MIASARVGSFRYSCHPYASASQGGNRKSGTTSRGGPSPEEQLSFDQCTPVVSLLLFAQGDAHQPPIGIKGSSGERGNKVTPRLPLVEPPGSHEPQTRLGTRRRPRQTVWMARLPREETQHGEGSAQGRMDKMGSSMLGRAATTGQSNRVDFIVPALDLSSVIAAHT
jgi:hypothetical protein